MSHSSPSQGPRGVSFGKCLGCEIMESSTASCWNLEKWVALLQVILGFKLEAPGSSGRLGHWQFPSPTQALHSPSCDPWLVVDFGFFALLAWGNIDVSSPPGSLAVSISPQKHQPCLWFRVGKVLPPCVGQGQPVAWRPGSRHLGFSKSVPFPPPCCFP